MNTEKFMVQQVRGREDLFYNRHVKFLGSWAKAQEYAADKNYGGGSRILNTIEPSQVSLDFVCPQCGGTELAQTQNVLTTYPITEIPLDGNLSYDHENAEHGDGITLGHHCNNCGFELVDENGNPIDDIMNVPQWIIDNTK